MKKIVGYLLLASVMLIPFRMVFLEMGEHGNTMHVLLFLTIVLGFFIGVNLIENKKA